MSKTATPNATLDDQLKGVREALSQKRDDRKAAAKTHEDAKKAFTAAGIDPKEMYSSAEYKAAEEATAALGKLDDEIADLEATDAGIVAMLGSRAPAPVNEGPVDQAAGLRAIKSAWNAQQVLASADYKKFVEDGYPTSQAAIGSQRMGQIASREQAAAFLQSPHAVDMMAADVGSADVGGMIQPDHRGVVPPAFKTLSLLDLFPVGTTDSNVVEYVQVLTLPSSAAEVAEGDLKPEESIVLQDADAPVRTIAGWVKVRRQALADAAGLRSLLNQTLPYDVRRRIESQMMVGNGTGQNLLGLLNTSGIGAPVAVDGDNTADAILRAITTIHLADGDPNFTALHPLTWQALLLMRENEAERTGAYLYGSPSMQVAPTIWGLAITNNRAVPAAQSLVGDSRGASLLVREGVNILFSDSDGDDFRRNRVTILAESRVAFPVWRPTSFAIANTPQPA